MTEAPPPQPFVAAVVLAAGASVRMGRPKLAIPVRGTPMIRRAAQAALASRCREVIVVLGAHADVYRPLLDGLDVRLVVNPDPAEGMGSSIRTGVEAVSPEAAGVVILLADQPLVDAEVIDRLIETAITERRRIVASAYHGTVGPPVYFDRALFLELLTLEGDRGARSVIEAYPQEGVAIALPEPMAADVDRPGDLEVMSA
ncbi:MAG: nucleotidyltransferase family protein [Armatimonadota bacterium]|nr:nucleotidyltransferase family protein [Armatimonadota bacterium]MDR7519881.1 nucleotidyltransferase family protein [Armatimonadota bacterium]MDR7550533.1 nucleotidyltransferase family protein [Armatimonadota bacterium]